MRSLPPLNMSAIAVRDIKNPERTYDFVHLVNDGKFPAGLSSLIVRDEINIYAGGDPVPGIIGKVPEGASISSLQRFNEMRRNREDLDGGRIERQLIKCHLGQVSAIGAPGVGVYPHRAEIRDR